MTPTPTRRATSSANSAGRKSRTPSLGTLDQSLFWRDVRQLILFMVLLFTAGVGLVVFMVQPRHVQAMLIYVTLVTACVSLIVAQMRRKHGR